MGNSVELSYMLILLYPLLSVGILFFLGAFCGRKEWMHAKFEDHCNSLSLAHDCGMNFSTCNIDMISFKVKTSKEAHIRIYEQRPIVDIMLGYEDCKQAVVRQHNRVGQTDELKAKFHREILSSTEYRTFYLKSEKNNIALFIVLEGKEHSILKWTTDWDSKLLKLSDIVISNSIQDTIDIEKPIATPGEWMFLVHQGDHMHENEEPLRSTEENDDEEKGSSENNDDEEKG
ncbi:unnamed protein product [Mytilus coruscus]|uniref:Farnesoic acid O-methyl transferase domain-containing protein n=1 Tax=Mytilus coruscus TaxID=42192 RepID=A0A6J8EPU1_MYTCO|nr:unnamed protein product [Mytilus coruscus]